MLTNEKSWRVLKSAWYTAGGQNDDFGDGPQMDLTRCLASPIAQAIQSTLSKTDIFGTGTKCPS